MRSYRELGRKKLLHIAVIIPHFCGILVDVARAFPNPMYQIIKGLETSMVE